ncbi:MAG: hypothetical protein AAF992_16075 [Bacteroidota bacterium]
MANPTIKIIESEKDKKQYIAHLLNDIQAFERMLKQDQFEQGVRRVGAEQEMVFVDKAFRLALIGP